MNPLHTTKLNREFQTGDTIYALSQLRDLHSLKMVMSKRYFRELYVTKEKAGEWFQ